MNYKHLSFTLLLILTLLGSAKGEDTPPTNRKPSTVISSDRLEMIRNAQQNEFKFFGKVNIESKDFSGKCDEMEVHALPQTEQTGNSKVGQIKEIIATGNVYLVTEDKSTPEPEKKEAHAGKAHIYPEEGKMVLTENPVVYCSKQGNFSGEKITLYKNTNQVVVESRENSGRSQVELPESFNNQEVLTPPTTSAK